MWGWGLERAALAAALHEGRAGSLGQCAGCREREPRVLQCRKAAQLAHSATFWRTEHTMGVPAGQQARCRAAGRGSHRRNVPAVGGAAKLAAVGPAASAAAGRHLPGGCHLKLQDIASAAAATAAVAAALTPDEHAAIARLACQPTARQEPLQSTQIGAPVGRCRQLRWAVSLAGISQEACPPCCQHHSPAPLLRWWWTQHPMLFIDWSSHPALTRQSIASLWQLPRHCTSCRLPSARQGSGSGGGGSAAGDGPPAPAAAAAAPCAAAGTAAAVVMEYRCSLPLAVPSSALRASGAMACAEARGRRCERGNMHSDISRHCLCPSMFVI